MEPNQTIAHYRITTKLGEGGMGEVWRATDTKLGRDVAIKILPESFARDAERTSRLTREAQVLASLNHPNIAAIYGIEESGGTAALIMELVEGPTVSDRLRDGPLPLEEVLAIARQIAEALEAAHAKGIIHRDLKPANIKVRPDGAVKVLDFGLSKAMQPDSGQGGSGISLTISATRTAGQTQAGTILGTAAYMSPEQARGTSVDKRTDVWAFGVVLFEMLTGRMAFSGETISDVLAAVLRADIDLTALPAGTPSPIRRLLRRCLERDVKRRLPDIAMARIEIDDASTPEPGAPQAPPTVVVKSSARAWILSGLCAAALAALSFVHFGETRPAPVTVRFTIEPPEKARFGPFDFLSLSPDGTRLAFRATSASAPAILWLRRLDSLAFQPLAGTEGALFPFWSPDGRNLGFFASGKLKKLDLASNTVETVATASGPGSWNRDGVILFGNGPGGAIDRVAASGGAVSHVSVLDPKHGETYHQWPSFLPDGRHFLFMIAGRDDSGIYVGSLDSQERKRLVAFSGDVFAQTTMAIYAEPGYLIYARGNQLLAAPFDARRLELKGAPAVIAPDVGRHPSGAAAFTAANNGILAFRPREAAPLVQLTWMDRGGRKTGTAGSAAAFTGFRLSPDGRQIAVMLDDKDVTSLWLVDAQRGTLSRFTSGWTSLFPVWSPDSNSIVYGSPRDSPPDLYRRSLASPQDERLMSSPAENDADDWSRDGRFIVYESTSGQANVDLWLLPLFGDRKPTPFLQTPYSELQARFSLEAGGPHWLAYVSNESGKNQVYVTTFPAPGRKWQVSINGGSKPEWRGDGKEIFFQSPDGQIMAVPVTMAPAFEVGAPHALFANPGRSFEVNADGQRFLVNAPAGEEPLPPVTVVVNWRR